MATMQKNKKRKKITMTMIKLMTKVATERRKLSGHCRCSTKQKKSGRIYDHMTQTPRPALLFWPISVIYFRDPGSAVAVISQSFMPCKITIL